MRSLPLENNDAPNNCWHEGKLIREYEWRHHPAAPGIHYFYTHLHQHTHFWRKSPPRPATNVASRRTNERRSCSPYGFDRLQRNPEDHPHGTVSVRQQGRLRGKLQICHLPVIRRINEHVDVAPPPQISLCFICCATQGSAHAAGIYCRTVIQQSHLICLCLMPGIKANWHSHDGRLKLGWFPAAHISLDFICP